MPTRWCALSVIRSRPASRYVAPEHIEQRVDRGDVTEYYEWQINRITLPDGRYGVVCYFRDISAHIQARTALQAADRQKDEFLAMLAHELRNPLAPLRNASELLAASARDEPRTQFSVECDQAPGDAAHPAGG